MSTAKPMHLLDTIFVSQLRKDGHATKYNGDNFSTDYTHWCIFSIPHTWNVIFYAALIDQSSKF